MGIVEKEQETSLDTDTYICMTLCTCAITILHREWMCLAMQGYSHITGNNLIPIFVSLLCICVQCHTHE